MTPLPISQFESQLPQLVSLIEDLVLIESPTTSKSGLDKLGLFVSTEMEARGAQVQTDEQTNAGNHQIGTWGEGGGGMLLVAHLDTVHPLGSLEHMPFEKRGNRLFGPGVQDMKASIAMALTAIEILRQNKKLAKNRTRSFSGGYHCYTANFQTNFKKSFQLRTGFLILPIKKP